MREKFYNNIYFIGLTAGRYGKRFLKELGRTIRKPFKVLRTLLFALFLLLDKVSLRAARSLASEFRLLLTKVKRTRSKLRTLLKNDRRQAGRELKLYVKKAFSQHGAIFRFALNTAVPVLALILMLSTIRYWSNITLALEIKYNGAVIGCAAAEADYLSAEAQAKERLITASATATDKNSLIAPAQYRLKAVNKTDLTDPAELCNRLIENSQSRITNACGVYVDGSFLCAVKNETDAKSVFDQILDEHGTDDPNAVTGFVEKIGYEQGLFPDNENTVWDAAKLSSKLRSKKSEAVYYEVKAGDTPSGIAQKFGLSTAQLINLNPSIEGNIHTGDRFLVAGEVNFVRVQVTKTETHIEAIRHASKKVKNDKLYAGTSRVTTKGSDGRQLVTELVSYVDGIRVSAREISRETVVQAVDEVVQVGTKRYSFNPGGTAVSYGGRFVWPVIGGNVISSPYGGRRHHGGVDIVKSGGRSTGLTVVAADAGTVTKVVIRNRSYGNYIMIDHGGGFSTLYAHLLDGSMKVRVGQKVQAGQPIGNVGSTGHTTGPHLHFEVRINGRRTDPMPYLRPKK